MANQLHCIIVDDDEIDRLTMLSLIRKYAWLHVESVYDNPVKALAGVAGSLPDIAFLDVDMADMSGLEYGEWSRITRTIAVKGRGKPACNYPTGRANWRAFQVSGCAVSTCGSKCIAI